MRAPLPLRVCDLAGADTNERGIGGVVPPERIELRRQGRGEVLEVTLRGVSPNFGDFCIREETATAEGNGSGRAIVESLFDAREQMMALFCIGRTGQQSRAGIVSCVSALGCPTAHQSLSNDVSNYS